jgi:4-amino-4-deoxy-L-arabinose transferase-like glycosyltransferase
VSVACAPPETRPRAASTPAPHLRLWWERRGPCLLLLSLWCGWLFFYGINAGDLLRNEGLRALLAAGFLESGNWVVPTLYGEPLFTKPPGMYAAIALLSLPFGAVTTVTARLPSALAGTAVVFLFYWYFARQLGRRAGLIAALLVPLSPMWLDKAPSAEIDALQTAWVTAAILFFLRALEAEHSAPARRAPGASAGPVERPALAPGARGWWLLALLCAAGGFLTKWTAPAFFYATAVPLLWWRGELRFLWGRRHLLSAALATALCLAWAGAAVVLGGWEEVAGTVGREAAQRLVPNHAGRPYPWLEALAHPLLILAVTLPCSVGVCFALRPGFAALWGERGRFVLQALRCWLWPNLLVWSLMSDHAPRHSFPMFPAVAGMAAMVWVAWLTGRLRWRVPRLRPAAALVLLLVGWMAAKGVFVHAVVPARNAGRAPRAKGELLASLVPADHILYLFLLKDEGLMFYYGRPAVRLVSPDALPVGSGPVYCIMTEGEWRQWRPWRPAEVVRHLSDQQGDPIVLVRLGGSSFSPLPPGERGEKGYRERQ